MGKTRTTKPAAAGNAANIEPEFVRVNDVTRLFGLKRGTVYNLVNDGRVRSVCLRVRGQKNGIRLIHLGSMRAVLSEAERQTQEAATAAQ